MLGPGQKASSGPTKGIPVNVPRRESPSQFRKSQAASTQLRAGCGCDLRVPEVRPPEGSAPPDPCPGDLPLRLHGSPGSSSPASPGLLGPLAHQGLAAAWTTAAGGQGQPRTQPAIQGLWGHRGQRSGSPGSLIPDIPTPNTGSTPDRNFGVLSQGIWDSTHKAECGGSGGEGATKLSSHWPAGYNATTPSLAALPRAISHLLSCKFLL